MHSLRGNAQRARSARRELTKHASAARLPAVLWSGVYGCALRAPSRSARAAGHTCANVCRQCTARAARADTAKTGFTLSALFVWATHALPAAGDARVCAGLSAASKDTRRRGARRGTAVPAGRAGVPGAGAHGLATAWPQPGHGVPLLHTWTSPRKTPKHPERKYDGGTVKQPAARRETRETPSTCFSKMGGGGGERVVATLRPREREGRRERGRRR